MDLDLSCNIRCLAPKWRRRLCHEETIRKRTITLDWLQTFHKQSFSRIEQRTFRNGRWTTGRRQFLRTGGAICGEQTDFGSHLSFNRFLSECSQVMRNKINFFVSSKRRGWTSDDVHVVENVEIGQRLRIVRPHRRRYVQEIVISSQWTTSMDQWKLVERRTQTFDLYCTIAMLLFENANNKTTNVIFVLIHSISADFRRDSSIAMQSNAIAAWQLQMIRMFLAFTRNI